MANTPKPIDPFTIPMTKLVIFHLLRARSTDYDDAVELMIAAGSEAEARAFAETAQGPQDPSVWHHPSVEVRYMGVAFEDTEPGIFLEKFNG